MAMENIGIWLMVIIAWILFIVSFLIPGVDWNLTIFLVLTVIAFTLIADWLISDTRTKKGRRANRSRSQPKPF